MKHSFPDKKLYLAIVSFCICCGIFIAIFWRGSTPISSETHVDISPTLVITDINSDIPPKATTGTILENDNKGLTVSWVTRPNHRLTGKLIDHIATLEDSFAKGNHHAGYILAVKLKTCRLAPLTRNQLEVDVDSLIKDNMPQDMIERRISNFEFCEGIKASDREKHFDYFTLLAESGFTTALEVIGIMPDKMYMEFSKNSHLQRDKYIEVKTKFQMTKYQYLSKAASQGSMKALLAIANRNTHKVNSASLTRYSPVSLALANAIALKYFTEDNRTYSDANKKYNRLFKTATAEEIYIGEELSLEIIASIKDFGQAYEIRDAYGYGPGY